MFLQWTALVVDNEYCAAMPQMTVVTIAVCALALLLRSKHSLHNHHHHYLNHEI